MLDAIPPECLLDMDDFNLDSTSANRPLSELQTFVEVLQWRARRDPERLALSARADAGSVTSLTYGQLDHIARAVAVKLQAKRCVGERAVIILPQGIEFVLALIGCWYSRVTAVPMPEADQDRSSVQIRQVVEDAGARVLISTREMLDVIDRRNWKASGAGKRVAISIDQIDLNSAESWTSPAISSQTLALLQYTAGATGRPKSIRLQHRHLLEHAKVLHRAMACTKQDVAVMWLPPHQGMGLVGGLLQPLYGGYPVHLLAPSVFYFQPLHWLEVISKHRATISAAPNFAYDFCTHAAQNRNLQHLDLSNWRLAVNCGDVIHQQTLKAFSCTFAAQGFRPTSFFPCYSLVESPLPVASGDPYQDTRVLTVRREDLSHGTLQPSNDGITLVSSGHVTPEISVRIVDSNTLQPIAEGEIGEIWVSGSVADGYWRRPQATQEIFFASLINNGGPWLRTGDLGALVDQQLYVTGRLKDLIVDGDRHHYPSHIELTVVSAHPAICKDGVAAFSTDQNQHRTLALVVELLGQLTQSDLDNIRADILESVLQQHGLQIESIIFAPCNSVARTTCGKINRGKTRDRFQQGKILTLQPKASPPP